MNESNQNSELDDLFAGDAPASQTPAPVTAAPTNEAPKRVIEVEATDNPGIVRILSGAVFEEKMLVPGRGGQPATEHIFSLRGIQFNALHQTLRGGVEQPAPGILFEVTRDGAVIKSPVAYGGYAGGLHVDTLVTRPDKTVEIRKNCRWGYDRKTGEQGEAEYSNNAFHAFINLVLYAAAELLDTDAGLAFLASLQDPAVVESTKVGRPAQPGFRRALAANSSHYAITRQVATPADYEAVARAKALARSSGQSTRTVDMQIAF